MRKTLINLSIILGLALALSACASQTQTTATGTTAAVQTTAATQTTAQTTIRPDPAFELVNWQMFHIPPDEYSDLEQREIMLQLKASEPLPTGVALSVEAVFLIGEETVLTADTFFMDTSFAGLTDITVVVSCHNYELDQAVLDSLADIDQIELSASVAYMSESVSEDAPMACQVIDKEQFELVKDAWGIREDYLSCQNDNYPELGAAVLSFKSSEDLLIVPMSSDYEDPAVYMGYVYGDLDWDDVAQIILCAEGSARTAG